MRNVLNCHENNGVILTNDCGPKICFIFFLQNINSFDFRVEYVCLSALLCSLQTHTHTCLTAIELSASSVS